MENSTFTLISGVQSTVKFYMFAHLVNTVHITVSVQHSSL